MIKLNEEGMEELWNDYDTTRIFYAVDALDKVRYVIGDDEDFRPPEIRQQLLRIHKLASNTLTGGYNLTDEEVEELASLVDEADMTIFDMVEELKKILAALRPLREKMFSWEEE